MDLLEACKKAYNCLSEALEDHDCLIPFTYEYERVEEAQWILEQVITELSDS